MSGIEEVIEIRANNNDGDVIDVAFYQSGALIDWSAESISEVKFYAFNLTDGTTYINGVAAATRPSGVLRCQQQDLPTPLQVGRFKCYYAVIQPGGRSVSYPRSDNLVLKINR